MSILLSLILGCLYYATTIGFLFITVKFGEILGIYSIVTGIAFVGMLLYSPLVCGHRRPYIPPIWEETFSPRWSNIRIFVFIIASIVFIGITTLILIRAPKANNNWKRRASVSDQWRPNSNIECKRVSEFNKFCELKINNQNILLRFDPAKDIQKFNKDCWFDGKSNIICSSKLTVKNKIIEIFYSSKKGSKDSVAITRQMEDKNMNFYYNMLMAKLTPEQSSFLIPTKSL